MEVDISGKWHFTRMRLVGLAGFSRQASVTSDQYMGPFGAPLTKPYRHSCNKCKCVNWSGGRQCKHNRQILRGHFLCSTKLDCAALFNLFSCPTCTTVLCVQFRFRHATSIHYDGQCSAEWHVMEWIRPPVPNSPSLRRRLVLSVFSLIPVNAVTKRRG